MRGMDDTTWVAIGAVAAAIAAAAGWLAAIVAVVTAIFFYRQLQEQKDTTQEERIARHVKAEFGDQFSKMIAIEKQARDTVEQAQKAATATREEGERMIAKLAGLLQQADTASRKIAGEAETASETVDALLQDLADQRKMVHLTMETLRHRRDVLTEEAGSEPANSPEQEAIYQELNDVIAVLNNELNRDKELRSRINELQQRRRERTISASALLTAEPTISATATVTNPDSTPQDNS